MKIIKILTSGLMVISAASLAAHSFASSYSEGGWPTLHYDSGNRRAVDIAINDYSYSHWEALAGAAVLTAPVTSPDGKSLYVTTGLAAGNSNLHAFSIDGELLWQSEPWQDANTGIDGCAFLSSPIVDQTGDIYISDCNQLFALHADGSAAWTIDLPPLQQGDWVAAGDHPVNAFTTAAFTEDGHLLGVTNFGDVMVIDRRDGAILNQAFRLDAELSPYAETVPMPDSLLAQDLMDPALREWTWQLIFGGSMRSANTPAVNKENRIFVVGSSDSPGIGALYGLDLLERENQLVVEVAFATQIGIGSGSSPALSPSGHQAYVSDEEGWFYAIDTETGDIKWRVKTTAAAGAAAVDHDGNVFALQSSGASVVALTPSGDLHWHSDISELDSGLPDSLLLGSPLGSANGNPLVTRDSVVIPVMYGYSLPFLDFNVPVLSVLVALDKDSGKATKIITPLVDDSSGITALLPDGTLVNSLGAIVTSALDPLRTLLNWLLPGDLEMLEARGGIQVSRPMETEP